MMLAYNPRLTDYERLKRSLVGRGPILNDILSELRLPEGVPPKQHWILYGPRGIGKTHLLTLVYHEARRDPELARLWLPVQLPEELRMARSLADLLERAAGELCRELDKDGEIQAADDLGAGVKSARQRLHDAKGRAEACFSLLDEVYRTTGRRILLLVENLQDLLGKKMTEIERRTLRSHLQTHESILIVGTAVTVFGALKDHREPFHNFFHAVRIPELSVGEMTELIFQKMEKACDRGKAWSRQKKNLEPRLKAACSLTGGIPRMGVFLAEILCAEIDEEHVSLMEGLLDELTPYFDAIFKDLPDGEKRVLDALAESEHPAMSPSEIAKRLDWEPGQTRIYVKKLKDEGYIRLAFSDRQSSYYCLNEHLYRVWFQMRESGMNDRTIWLVELLIILYGRKNILSNQKKIRSKIKMGHDSSIFENLILEACSRLENHPNFSLFIESVIGRDDVILYAEQAGLSLEVRGKFGKVMDLRNAGKQEEALLVLDNLLSELIDKRIDQQDVDDAFLTIHAMFVKVLIFDSLGRMEETLNILQEMEEYYGHWENDKIAVVVAEALFRKAATLSLLGRRTEAIGILDEAINKYAQRNEAAFDIPVALAMFIKATELNNFEDIETELKAYDVLIERYKGSDEEEIVSLIDQAESLRDLIQARLIGPEAALSTAISVLKNAANADWSFREGIICRAIGLWFVAAATKGMKKDEVKQLYQILGGLPKEMVERSALSIFQKVCVAFLSTKETPKNLTAALIKRFVAVLEVGGYASVWMMKQVWICLTEPDALEAKRGMEDRGIAAVVEEIRRQAELSKEATTVAQASSE